MTSKKIMIGVITLILTVSFISEISFAEGNSQDTLYSNEVALENADNDGIEADGDVLEGSGTDEDPFKIYDKYDLLEIKTHNKSSFKLMNDIEFTVSDFDVDGDFYNDGKGWVTFYGAESGRFSGSFDGNGYSIKNLVMRHGYGFFGEMKKAMIKNVNFQNATMSINGVSDAGFVAKEMRGGSITNCRIFDSSITHTASQNHEVSMVGGFVGRVINGKIEQCTNYANLNGTSKSPCSMGGIAGEVDGEWTKITDCVNYGNVEAHYDVGGIAGSIVTDSDIKSCYNYGDIVGTYGRNDMSAGGIVGYMGKGSSVSEVSNVGRVSAQTSSERYSINVGGLAGCNEGSIKYSYNSGDVLAKGSDGVAANAGGISGLCKSSISNAFNSGNVSSSHRSGGITARETTGNSVIVKCYNSGVIKSSVVSGPIVSLKSSSASINNTYYLASTATRSSTSKTKKYGSSVSSKNMKKKTTYKKYDFKNRWAISSKKTYKYPTLRKVKYTVPVKVKKIKLNCTTKTLEKGKTYKLKKYFTPSNTTNKQVYWKSSNKSVAIVDKTGKVSAVGIGTANVTCKTYKGGKSVVCKITVIEEK